MSMMTTILHVVDLQKKANEKKLKWKRHYVMPYRSFTLFKKMHSWNRYCSWKELSEKWCRVNIRNDSLNCRKEGYFASIARSTRRLEYQKGNAMLPKEKPALLCFSRPLHRYGISTNIVHHYHANWSLLVFYYTLNIYFNSLSCYYGF